MLRFASVGAIGVAAAATAMPISGAAWCCFAVDGRGIGADA